MSDKKATPAEAAPSPAASTVDGHAPQKKRIRAVVACSHCRSKRSKCDGIPGQQACTQCQQRGIECEMSDGKRNRGHYKPQAEALAKRVRALEEALAEARAANRQLVMQMQQQQQQQRQQQQQQQNGQQQPKTSFVPISSTSWDPNGHHMQMDDVSGVSVGFGLQDHRLDHLDRLDVESVHSTAIPTRAESIAASSIMPPPAHTFSPSVHQTQQHSCRQSISSHNHNLLLDHGSIVMSNVGTGNMYSGPAANNNSHAPNYALSVQSSIEPSPQTAPVPPPATLPSIHTVNLAVPIPIMRRQPCCTTLDLTSSAVDYLLGLFFHRYQQMMKFVSQQEFMTQYAENTDADDRDGNRATRTSNPAASKRPRNFKRHHPCCHKQNCALFLAMLAAAIRYSTRPDVTERFLTSDGENKLATAARRAVEVEVSRPTLTTIQTILILCEVETTVDNQMTSYMFSCLAAKLIFEMGLDLGSSTSNKALTAEETTIRHWLVWAAAVHDQFWAVFLRRPLAIKNSALHLSRMAWRFAGGGDRKRHGLQHATNNGTPDEAHMTTPATFEDEVNENLLDFIELAGEVIDELYGPGSQPMLQSRSSPESQAATAAQSTAQHTAAGLNSGGFNGGNNDLGFGYENPHSNRTDGSSGGSSTYYNQYDGIGLPDILHEHAVQQQASDRLPDVAKLDARLDQWFGTLSEKVRQGPVSGQDCYQFLFVLHLHFHATKIILHRTRAFATQIGGGSPLSLGGRRLAQAAATAAATAADKQRHQSSPGNYPMQSPLASVVASDEAAAASMAALGQASIFIAKLFETYRRREDIRTLQCTGVQWAAMASEALTWYIETLPIDGAIEAVAHLQSLGRTIKDMTRTFLPAVYAYDRTTNALRMFQQRIDGGNDSPPQIQTLQALRQEQQLQQQQQQQYQQRLASQVSASASMNSLASTSNPQPQSISGIDMDMSMSAAHAHAQQKTQSQNHHHPFSLDTSSVHSAPDLTSSVSASVSAATFSASLAAAGAFDTDSAGGSRIGVEGNGNGSISALSMPVTKEQLQHTDTVYSATPGQDLTPGISAGAIQVGWPENGAWDWGDMLDRQ